jgi:hypothetical protein
MVLVLVLVLAAAAQALRPAMVFQTERRLLDHGAITDVKHYSMKTKQPVLTKIVHGLILWRGQGTNVRRIVFS